MTQPAPVRVREAVVRFAGDSGDGMQLAGTQFTTETAFSGNDLATFPNFPAEIRAPAGTLPGVSSFQIHFGTHKVWNPGDTLDTLVAMNPAALKVHLQDLKPGGTLIVNADAFNDRNVTKAGYKDNPLTHPEAFANYKVVKVAMTSLVIEALKDCQISSKEAEQSKNLFALGLLCQMYHRDTEQTRAWLERKFAKRKEIYEANRKALQAGYDYAYNAALFGETYVIEPAKMPAGKYRNVNGNQLLAYGLLTASVKANKPLFLGTYPITPASDILHELAKHKRFRVRSFQAEDEIAAVASAIGASYTGAIGVTTTSGPGLALKSEAIGLAVMTELPLVIVNVQRGGPSTGLPTKTEQADLLQAMFGRNGESPVVVLAAATPPDAFEMAFAAVRIALTHMTPVILLSDGFIANGAVPWLIPDPDQIPDIKVSHSVEGAFKPYARDPETLARPWVLPGTPGHEHRIGGIEKENINGGISYDADNHELMTRLRAEKIERVAREIPPSSLFGDAQGDVLVVGWGSTYGSICAAVETLRAQGKKVSALHIRYINPLPPDLGTIFARFKTILICEINSGQLALLLKARFTRPMEQYNRVRGLPLKQSDIEQRILELLGA